MHLNVAQNERSRWAVLAAVSLMFSLTILDGIVVNVAMHEISVTLGAGITSIQWLTTAYLIVFASLLVLCGLIADRIGARPIFTLGTLIFVFGSLVCGCAPSITILAVGRVLQGIGGALVVPTSMALIKQTFPDPARQATALSIWVGWSSFSLAAGLYLGGHLVEQLGWPSIFFINLPIGMIILLLSRHIRSETSPLSIWTGTMQMLRGPHSIDLVGLILSITAIASLIMASINIGNGRACDLPVLVPALCFVTSALLFIVMERRTDNPFVSFSLIVSPDVWRSCLAGTIVSFNYYGMMFFFGILFQLELNYSSVETGTAFFPMTATTVFGNIIGGQMSSRLGTGRTIAIGSALGFVGSILAAWTGLRQGWSMFIAIACILISLGVSIAVPALTYLSIRRANSQETSVISGLLNAARQLGAVLGIGVFGSFANLHQFDLAVIFPTIMWISAAAFVIGIAITCHAYDAP